MGTVVDFGANGVIGMHDGTNWLSARYVVLDDGFEVRPPVTSTLAGRAWPLPPAEATASDAVHAVALGTKDDGAGPSVSRVLAVGPDRLVIQAGRFTLICTRTKR